MTTKVCTRIRAQLRLRCTWKAKVKQRAGVQMGELVAIDEPSWIATSAESRMRLDDARQRRQLGAQLLRWFHAEMTPNEPS
jgi:hypothetical protein